MNFRKIVKLFESGNVCVVGEKGSGKDMLTANVVARRSLPYVSNVEYKKRGKLPVEYHKLDFKDLDCGSNTFSDFVSGKVHNYVYPFPIGCDVYISDCGVYLPAQYNNELNKLYKSFPTMMAISRHLGFNIHTNCQNLNRIWLLIREQSRTYITCLKCRVLKLPFNRQLVFQKIRIYEKYQSCVDNVPALHLPFYLYLSRDKMQARLYKLNYRISHGSIKERTLIYFNRSDYDTHHFRKLLKEGSDLETS